MAGIKLFEISDCIIYAQEGIVDCRTIAATPSFIEFQHEVRSAVQAIVNLYCGSMFEHGSSGLNHPDNTCGHTRVCNISDTFGEGWYSKQMAEILEEAQKRGYVPPRFDAVVFGIKKRAGFAPPFDLDKIMERYYIRRFD